MMSRGVRRRQLVGGQGGWDTVDDPPCVNVNVNANDHDNDYDYVNGPG